MKDVSMKTVRDVTKISGVSRRTLQYYDEIGLLKPDSVKPSGYRLYSEDNLARLWRILFYRELGFSLDEIKKILEKPPETERTLMEKHQRLLIEKQDRLDKIIQSIDQILTGTFQETMLKHFDTRAFEETKKQNQKAAERRLTEGDPFYNFFRPLIQYKLTSRMGVASMIRNIGSTSNLDWESLRLEGERLGGLFVAAMVYGSESSQAKKASEQFIQYVSRQLAPCDQSVIKQLAGLYLQDPDCVDETHPGLSQFISDSIQYYCEQTSQP